MNADEIARILDELGERIGPTGEYAWNVAVTGERINGIVGIVGGLVLIASTYIFYQLARWGFRIHAADKYSTGDMGAVFAIIGGMVVGGAGFICIGTSITSAFLPEYGVIRDLIGALR